MTNCPQKPYKFCIALSNDKLPAKTSGSVQFNLIYFTLKLRFNSENILNI